MPSKADQLPYSLNISEENFSLILRFLTLITYHENFRLKFILHMVFTLGLFYHDVLLSIINL